VKKAAPKKAAISPSLHVACHEQVFDTMMKWETPTNWKDVITDSSEGAHAMQSPTDSVGVWIHMVNGKDNTTIARSTQDTSVEVRFREPSCVPELRTTQTDPTTANDKGAAYTDKDLIKTLDASKAKKSQGILYAWSPRMNLSVTGAKEAVAYAKKENLELTLLADPEVPAKELEKVLKEHGLPESASIRMRSSDLANRGILIHYPAMIIYSNGQLKNQLRPGYNVPKRFDKFVKESLKT
jgi:hypothetical protein